MSEDKPPRPTPRLNNIRIHNCEFGMVGNARNMHFGDVRISDTTNPISLDSAENVSFQNLSITGDKAVWAKRARNPSSYPASASPPS